MREILLNYSLDELLIKQIASPPFKIKQIYEWLYKGCDFAEMNNISLDLRNHLEENYIAQPITIIKVKDAKDKSAKFLYKLTDDNIIEGMLMKYKYGYTLCVSTQIGCRMGCVFCASGKNGLIRNLTAGEIAGQVTAVNKYLGGSIKDRKITNIVLMGMGEPLDNYDNTTKFLKLISDVNGLNISQRNISLSTSGLTDKIKKLADEGFNITLTISLHASDDITRSKIMPVNKAYNIEEILNATDYYFNKTGRRVIFEYTLIEDKNCNDIDAEKLSKLLKKRVCHVNLIPLNEIKENKLKTCSRKKAEDFLQILTKNNISATIRRPIGAEINGACGQLRANHIAKEEYEN